MGAEPSRCQCDIFSFKTQLALRKGKNMHGATAYTTTKLRSEMLKRLLVAILVFIFCSSKRPSLRFGLDKVGSHKHRSATLTELF
jgi:hypothetical protein